MIAVDGHAHVFERHLVLAESRRYAPAYDARVEDYLRLLDAHGLTHGVLIQPSFLGTDNTYMVAALRRFPGRLRGIAVVAPEAGAGQLAELARAGVVGLRLNLLEQADPPLESTVWRGLLGRAADLGWQVELQAEAHRWPTLLAPLLDSGVTVVIDHFGLPDGGPGVDDPGFRALLAWATADRLFVKLSGPYRLGPRGERVAAAAMPLLRQAFGLERLVWGSDWPHTRFEHQTNYRAALAGLRRWLPDPADRRVVLADAPARLFRLAA